MTNSSPTTAPPRSPDPAARPPSPAATQAGWSDLHRAIVVTLLYYDAFEFPLDEDELVRYLAWPDGLPLDGQGRTRVVEALRDLASWGLIEAEGEPRANGRSLIGLVSDHPEGGSQFARRHRAAQTFASVREDVADQCRLIQRFPLVEGVAISGTLSKGVFHADDDYDFFVVTRERRVWLCRTLLMLFKRVALGGSRQRFCVNYLIAIDSLQVPDRDLFTANEIAWLQPMTHRDRGHSADQSSCAAFLSANSWVTDFLPNWSPGRESSPRRQGSLSRVVESLLASRLFDPLERTARALIGWRNRRRHAARLGTAYSDAMRQTESSSKHHPRNQRLRILERHRNDVATFDRRNGTDVARILPAGHSSTGTPD